MKSYIYLFASIGIAVAGWAYGQGPWGELLSRAYLPVIIGQICSILIAWAAPSDDHPEWLKTIMSKLPGNGVK